MDVTTVLASEAYVLFYRKASEGEFSHLALSGTLMMTVNQAWRLSGER